MNPLSRWWYGSLARKARRARKQGPEVIQLFNEQGVFFQDKGCYSCIPTAQEIEASFERRGPQPPYLDSGVFDNARMLAFLDELQAFAAEFTPPAEGDFTQPADFYWKNEFFSWADALSYYCIIRRFRPPRVVEVGSGFSSLVAIAALRRNGAGELLCIEPCPRAFLRGRPGLSRLVVSPVQEVPREFFDEQLADGSILFIDSTHTVKAGGDCLYLYLKTIPHLKAKVLIHAHDIFLPEAMPKDWHFDRNLHLTEQYLLLALLMGNPNFEVLYGSHYHRLVNPARFAEFNRPVSRPEGASFWFRKR